MTPTTPTCRKGATFHTPEPSENLYFTPPSLPRRSQTSLEDVIDAKKRRAALALEDFDRIDGASSSATPTIQSYRDEGLPFPQGLLHNTINSAPGGEYPDRMAYIKQEPVAPVNERKASLRPQRQTRRAAPISDSGLGSSIMTKSSAGGAVTAITMSAAPASKTHLQRMSRHASDVVNQHILQKLLADRSFKDFHPIVRDCPRAIEQREIVCLRDLEKTLTLSAPHRAKTAGLYLQFCESTILCIQTALTIGNLSDQEQTRPTDRPYTPGYFTDLVAQVRQAALQIAAAREKAAKGEELDEMDAKVSDEIKLYGGLTENGRPAELVRMKNGQAFSVATGELVDTEDAKSHPMKRSLSEEDEETESVYRSMARRKKSATAAELAPKRCSHEGCDKEFKRPCDLTKHEKTHSRPWKCSFPDCRYHKDGWPTEKELHRHLNDRHSKEPKMYNCLFKSCTYKSKRESNAKQHMEKAHGWEYKRSKSNGKKRKDEGSFQMATPSNTGAPTPVDQDMNDEYDQNNGSVTYEQSVYSPDGLDHQNNGSIAYENSAYSPEYPAHSNFSPNLSNFNDDMDMDVMPQLHIENYLDSPNSNLRHGSTDSSIPSPYGGDNLAGFHLEAGNGALMDFPSGNQFDFDFDLFNNDLTTSHMQLPQPSVYQQQLPEFTGSSCSNVQQISPGGHGNHVLYTPPSLNAVDEGFEDYAPGADFPLFSSTTTSSSSNSMLGMNPTLAARVPLFGEIPSTQDMYPSFLNTQECIDLNWEMN